jgi:hypothetical protein
LLDLIINRKKYEGKARLHSSFCVAVASDETMTVR